MTAEDRAWTRLDRALFAGLVLLLLASQVWLVHPWYEASAGTGSGTNDASMYILCAKALLAGDGYAYLGEPFTVRPPGFSLLIAPILAARGLDFHALNLFVSSFGVAAAALLFVLLRPRAGPWLAASAALLVFLNPGFQRMSNQVMTDVPGVALALACLVLERWVSRAPGHRRELVLALAIGLSAYVRSIEILLVPAILAARVVEQIRRREGRHSWIAFARTRVLVLAVVPALVLLPWSLRNAANAPEAPVDQNYIYSYSTGMWNTDVGDPSSPRRSLAEIAEVVPTRGAQVLSLVGTRMRTSEGGALEVGLGGAALLAALALLCWRRRPSDVFLFLVFGVLAVYFGFKDRLALPVFVFSAAACAELLALILARAARTARIGLSGARASAVAALPVLALALADFRPRAGWDGVEALHAEYRSVAHALEGRLAPDARLGSTIGWHLSVYLERPVWSLLFAMRRSGSVESAGALIEKYQLDTIVLTRISEADRSVLPWFRAKYGGVDLGPVAVFDVAP